MAHIEAFRGIRYDLGHVGCLSEVIAPPYDVISARQRTELAASSPANIVHVTLAPEGVDPTGRAEDLSVADYLTIAYDPSGTERWSARYRGAGGGRDAAAAVVIDAIRIAGQYRLTASRKDRTSLRDY